MTDKFSIATIAAALATGLSMGLAPGTSAQAGDEARYPDWSGQWLRNYSGFPRYDPSKPLRQQNAPLKPEYQARFEASMADQDAGGHGLDTAYTCIPQGMPRMMSGVSLMEFLISPSTTHVLFGQIWLGTRRIYTDGRAWPKIDDPTFTGYSIGTWLDSDGDGRYDTLEVETRHVRGPHQWDQSGMPMADDDDAVIKERLYLDKSDKTILHNDVTTMDNSLTRPWSVQKVYKRQAHEWWPEENCVEGQGHVTIGKQNYFLSGDGTIMPSHKDQPPPDLKYFKKSNN